jgi:hypothetical protein
MATDSSQAEYAGFDPAALPTSVVTERVFRSAGRKGNHVGCMARQHPPVNGEWPRAMVGLAPPFGFRDLGADYGLGSSAQPALASAAASPAKSNRTPIRKW